MTDSEPRYLLWDTDSDASFCVLGYRQGFADDYKLMIGDAALSSWPTKVSFAMDPDFKKQRELSDCLTNPNNVLVVSKRLREFLISHKVPNLEFLPVTILDHKKKVASQEYCIAHLVTTQDCIDTAASQVTWNNINPDYISTMSKLIVDETRIDQHAQLFRAKHHKILIFVRSDLAAAVEDAGFTNIKFWRLSDYC